MFCLLSARLFLELSFVFDCRIQKMLLFNGTVVCTLEVMNVQMAAFDILFLAPDAERANQLKICERKGGAGCSMSEIETT